MPTTHSARITSMTQSWRPASSATRRHFDPCRRVVRCGLQIGEEHPSVNVLLVRGRGTRSLRGRIGTGGHVVARARHTLSEDCCIAYRIRSPVELVEGRAIQACQISCVVAGEIDVTDQRHAGLPPASSRCPGTAIYCVLACSRRHLGDERDDQRPIDEGQGVIRPIARGAAGSLRPAGTLPATTGGSLPCRYRLPPLPTRQETATSTATSLMYSP